MHRVKPMELHANDQMILFGTGFFLKEIFISFL